MNRYTRRDDPGEEIARPDDVAMVDLYARMSREDQMSDITDKINDYKAGKITLDSLASMLGSRDYVIPERMRNAPSDPFEAEQAYDEAPHYTDESWDEVERAYHSGLLSEEEYMKIHEAATAAHG